MSIGWGEIIINEFFILQANSTHTPQYIELYNNSSDTISVENWSITTLDDSGLVIIEMLLDNSGWYVQANNLEIDPFGYFLISSSYCNYSAFGCYFYNQFQSDIDAFYLYLPLDGKGSFVLTDDNNVVIDIIDYDIAEGWSVGEDSRGHSLALQSTDLDNSYPENWSLSPESAISPFLYETGSEVLNFGTPREANSFTDGCTDPEACNYDETATDDDGSCIYSNGITDSLLLGSWKVGDVFGYNNHYCEGVPDTMINVPDEFENFVVEINLDGILYNFDSSISYMWNVPDSMYTNTLCYYTPLYDDLNCSVFYELTENNYHLSISDPTPEQEMCLQVQYDKIISGCTDPEASNYDPDATEDDGSCQYCPEGTITTGDYCIPNNFSYNATPQQAFYYFEFVHIDNTLITAEDWVGAFNSNVCVGASQCGSGICSVLVMGYDGMAHSEGYMQNGDIPSFKIFDSSENIYYGAIPSEDIPWQNMAFNVIDSLTVFRDCNGVLGGMAYEDDCGLCDSDPTNDCFYECDLGDVNCDDSLNVLDIVIAANMVLADEYDEIADMNEDGELNILDLVIMVNLVLYGDAGACVDIDGNVYETVQIGDQLWMAENLKVTHYKDGSEIPNIINNGDWGSLSAGAYGVYNNDSLNAVIYGNLYNWYTVDDDRGVCPDGFHVPTDEEFMELEMFLGMSEEEANSTEWRGTDEGSKLAGNADLWNNGTLENNSEFGTSGFSAFPAGYRSTNGFYYDIDYRSYFWSSSEFNSYKAWYRYLFYSNSNVSRFTNFKHYGHSIRCLRD